MKSFIANTSCRIFCARTNKPQKVSLRCNILLKIKTILITILIR
ncbi:hypothetical protein P262_00393 [Cronobacter malonaticus]|uniref:Uncharacterized protein n=1 Tax=Cronobacter malonaticus TaxID=413503 RepID=V5TVD8_9ENTR|nr:hypothetical protein P262_00393 [Cronobacter malonaticus]CCJ94454.1 hypothetical protein BN131_2127 [Cronobacter malonaticus 681]